MNKNKGKEIVKLSSLLGPGSLCNGDFVSEGSARIDGTVNGNVKVEGTLILGSEGIVNGSIEAMAVQIGGQVYGDIYAPEHAELSSTAKVTGDLATAVIVIDENALFQGNINMKVDVPVKKEKEGLFKKNSSRIDKRENTVTSDFSSSDYSQVDYQKNEYIDSYDSVNSENVTDEMIEVEGGIESDIISQILSE